jgi:hypothetical protein
MHWVPNKNNEDNPVKYSERVAQQFNSDFWITRISESIENHKTIDIEPRVEGGQILTQSELLFQCNDKQYVQYTKDIAEYLYRTQNKKNISDGFIIVFCGTSNENNNFVCILKLEGLTASEALFDKEASTFNFIHIDNIIITNKTKIFKMFYVEYDGTIRKRIIALDDQRTSTELSNFWLYDFLCCKLCETPENLTKQFFSFISKISENKRLMDHEKFQIKTALYSELNSNKKSISIMKFKENYIPKEFQPYFESEKSKNQIYKNDFPKIINEKFRKQITNRKFILENGIIAIVPIVALEEKKNVEIIFKNDEKYLKVNSKILNKK